MRGRVIAGLSIIGMALCACSPQGQPGSAPAPQAGQRSAAVDAVPFVPEATVLEMMEYVVMPNAQILWDSVGTIVSQAGIEDLAPETEEDWTRVRAAAITLAEASNALMIRGRDVDVPGTPSDSPEELSPDQIQDLRQQEWGAWVAHTVALHGAVMQMLDAIDDRDSAALLEGGGPLDEACESCHLQFWYPPDLEAAQ